MTEWVTEAEWETPNGLHYRIDERYNRRKALYEQKFMVKAHETWFVRNKWESEDGVQT